MMLSSTGITEMVNNTGKIALYIHIPFCTSKCRYCSFYSVPLDKNDVPAVINAMLRELDSYKLPKNFADTIYIGGGSPTCIADEQLFFLISELAARAGKATEFTIEVNPTQVNYQTLSTLTKLGVNRLSIGAQSFDNADLNFLGRLYNSEDIVQAVNDSRRAGFKNISLDLIFAIPGQAIKIWRKTLESAIQLGIEHVSAYSLSYEKDTPLYKELQGGCVRKTDEETDRKMYELAITMLREAGIAQYEISNFARKGFECRHNLVYWANRPYIGIGPAAASYWQGARTANVNDIQKYVENIEQGQRPVAETDLPDARETACQTAILNLRRIRGIDLNEFQQQTGFNALNLFSEPVAKYKELGLISVSTNSIELTPEALPIADSILCDFVLI
jgi:oxygen-independent coproporphyrinogen-3 oxidase